MSWRKPERGLVINYSYLWARETDSGREEGQKNRPCAIILASYADPTGIRVRVLPITHTPPEDPAEAIEIPGITKNVSDWTLTDLGSSSMRSMISSGRGMM
jgi:hypothetical protein